MPMLINIVGGDGGGEGGHQKAERFRKERERDENLQAHRSQANHGAALCYIFLASSTYEYELKRDTV